jgi:putative SOS response-associated peptidase YedK
MIERYSITASPEQVGAYFGVDAHGYEKPHFNAAPSQLLPVITMKSEGLSHFYWGVAPQWAKNKSIGEKIINVRQEQILERTAMRKRLAKFRCVAPADGFYAWKKLGKKTSIPNRFELQGKGLFSIASIWEEYDDENGERFHTFTIITRAANRWVEAIHDRMPVILDPMEHKLWLDPGSDENTLMHILNSPSSLVLNHYTVSHRINSPAHDDATLVIPTPPADQFGNLTLFD